MLNKLKEKGYEAKNSREMWRDKKITGLSSLTGLDAPSFNHQFDRGENESILIWLRPALGLGLLGVGPPGHN